jgi:hypothetical protein
MQGRRLCRASAGKQEPRRIHRIMAHHRTVLKMYNTIIRWRALRDFNPAPSDLTSHHPKQGSPRTPSTGLLGSSCRPR